VNALPNACPLGRGTVRHRLAAVGVERNRFEPSTAPVGSLLARNVDRDVLHRLRRVGAEVLRV
jgi:hypothetical protein